MPSDATATTTVNGTPAVVTIAVPGQNGLVTFPCSAGQSVTVRMSSNALNPLYVYLHDPDGAHDCLGVERCEQLCHLCRDVSDQRDL